MIEGQGRAVQRGPAGQPGPRGYSVLSGTGVPQPEVGNPGDFYFDKLSQRFYGPKLDSTGWVLAEWIQLGFAASAAATEAALAAADLAIANGASAAAAAASANDAAAATNAAIAAAEAATLATNQATADAESVVAASVTIFAAKDVAVAAAADAENARDTINGGVVFRAGTTNDETSLLYFIDAINRIIGEVLPNGAWNVILNSIIAADGTELFSFESNDLSLGQVVIVDQNNRILWSSAEPAAAAAVADAKAVAAQNSANTALVNAATADGKAVVADAKATVAQASAAALQPNFTNDQGALVYFVDALNRIIGEVGHDGGWLIDLARLAASDGTEIFTFESNDIGLGPLIVVDQNNRILWSSGSPNEILSAQLDLLEAEVVSARGEQASLDARLSKTISAWGYPKVSAWGRAYMRNCHQRLASRALGSASQLVVAAVGDSYFQNRGRWVGPFAENLIAKYGDAGGGWCGFGYFGGTGIPGDVSAIALNGNARATYTVTLSTGGDWTASYNNSNSVDLSLITSTTVGDKVTVVAPALPVHNAVNLHYNATAAGVVRYRWNGGSWTTLNVQGTGTVGELIVAPLSGVPSGAFTLEIEVVTATVKLCGVDLKSAANGVRVHKLGGSGSNINSWTTQAVKADWQAAMTSLGVNAYIQGECGNSQSFGMTPSSWKTQLALLLSTLSVCGNRPDIMILMPMENQRTTNVYPVSAYADKAFQVAVENNYTWRWLQDDFGIVPADYAYGSAYPLFNIDGLHPEPATGGVLMVAAANEMVIPVF